MTSIRNLRSTIILAFSTFIGVLAGQYPNIRGDIEGVKLSCRSFLNANCTLSYLIYHTPL